MGCGRPRGPGHPGDPVRPRADPTVIRGGVQVRRPCRAARTGVGLGRRQEGSRPDPRPCWHDVRDRRWRGTGRWPRRDGHCVRSRGPTRRAGPVGRRGRSPGRLAGVVTTRPRRGSNPCSLGRSDDRRPGTGSGSWFAWDDLYAKSVTNRPKRFGPSDLGQAIWAKRFGPSDLGQAIWEGPICV